MTVDNEIPTYEPEDGTECGCESCDFGDEQFSCGVWNCPDCGAVQ